MEIFHQGSETSGQKKNPGKMRENLTNKYPYRFSIPSEIEIKKFISSQAQQTKNISKSNNPSEKRGRKQKGTELKWMKILRPIVDQHFYSTPEVVYNLFLELVSSDDQSCSIDLPMDKTGQIDKTKIKAKINQERAKMKKKATRDLI